MLPRVYLHVKSDWGGVVGLLQALTSGKMFWLNSKEFSSRVFPFLVATQNSRFEFATWYNGVSYCVRTPPRSWRWLSTISLMAGNVDLHTNFIVANVQNSQLPYSSLRVDSPNIRVYWKYFRVFFINFHSRSLCSHLKTISGFTVLLLYILLSLWMSIVGRRSSPDLIAFAERNKSLPDRGW